MVAFDEEGTGVGSLRSEISGLMRELVDFKAGLGDKSVMVAFDEECTGAGLLRSETPGPI
jgi:hypothetical protein